MTSSPALRWASIEAWTKKAGVHTVPSPNSMSGTPPVPSAPLTNSSSPEPGKAITRSVESVAARRTTALPAE